MIKLANRLNHFDSSSVLSVVIKRHLLDCFVIKEQIGMTGTLPS